MLSQAAWPQSEPTDAKIKAALTDWLKSSAEEHEQVMDARVNKKFVKLCNIWAYMAVDGYGIKDKNVSDDKAIYKLRPKFVFTKDLKDIAAETKCNMDPVPVSAVKESYGVVEKGKVAEGKTLRGYWNALLTMGKFKNGWKMMSYS